MNVVARVVTSPQAFRDGEEEIMKMLAVYCRAKRIKLGLQDRIVTRTLITVKFIDSAWDETFSFDEARRIEITRREEM